MVCRRNLHIVLLSGNNWTLIISTIFPNCTLKRSITLSSLILSDPTRNWLSFQTICNRWNIVARPGLEPRAFRWPCEYTTTELPSHPVISPTSFHLNPSRLQIHRVWHSECMIKVVLVDTFEYIATLAYRYFQVKDILIPTLVWRFLPCSCLSRRLQQS